jgi:dTDP-D-glucose 4,6-dehydratase
MNATLPTSGITDQILELHGTETRKSIYIGDLVKGVLTITNNGLTTDNFIINGGTWDSN